MKCVKAGKEIWHTMLLKVSFPLVSILRLLVKPRGRSNTRGKIQILEVGKDRELE